MERNREAEAASNLRRIKDLTGRMAEISKHLMTFARKPRRELHPVLLAEVLDDTLDFLRTRLERAGAEGTVDQPDRRDRKSVGSGKSVSVRVGLGGRRRMKNKKHSN